MDVLDLRIEKGMKLYFVRSYDQELANQDISSLPFRGVVGDLTPLTDENNVALHIGDVVEIVNEKGGDSKGLHRIIVITENDRLIRMEAIPSSTLPIYYPSSMLNLVLTEDIMKTKIMKMVLKYRYDESAAYPILDNIIALNADRV